MRTELAELFKKLSCFVLGRELEVIMQIGVYKTITMALHIDFYLWHCILSTLDLASALLLLRR